MDKPSLIPTWLRLSNEPHAADAVLVADVAVGYLRTVLADDVLVGHHLSLPEPGLHRVYEAESWDILEVWSDVQTVLKSSYGSTGLTSSPDQQLTLRRAEPDSPKVIRSYRFLKGGAACTTLTVTGNRGPGQHLLGLMATVTHLAADSVRFMYAPNRDARSSDQLANNALLRALGEIARTQATDGSAPHEGVCALRTEYGVADIAYRFAPSPSDETKCRKNLMPSSPDQSSTTS